MKIRKTQYYDFEDVCKLHNPKIGGKRKVFHICLVEVLLYGIEVWGGSTFETSWNEIENNPKIVLMETNENKILKIQSSHAIKKYTSHGRTSHATSVQVYHESQEDAQLHRLTIQAWNIRCKVQKINKSKILSSGWALDIMKRCRRKDLLELSGDAMKYVIIEDTKKKDYKTH